jgi:SAM-dependent methyltransferase
VDGPAEATTLLPASVDLVTAATAFHWFDPARTRAEALRILRPGGWALLLWNLRATGESPMLAEYAALLSKHAPEYPASKPESRADPAKLTAFFGTDRYRTHVVPNFQVLDLEGLKGRMMSSSYSPKQGHPQHAPLMAGVTSLFERYQEHGHVRIEYGTHLYACQMRPLS